MREGEFRILFCGQLEPETHFYAWGYIEKNDKAGGEGSIFLIPIISQHMSNFYIMVPVALKPLE